MAFSTKSISFDGIDGYVDLGDAFEFQKEYTDAFSMSCWAKTKATSAINTLVGKMDDSDVGYLMFLNSSGQFEAVLRNTPATDSLRVRTDIERYNDGGWHHFVMTFDGSSSLLLYVDGIVKTTTTVYNNLTSSILNAASLQIGAYDGPNSPFEGNIDEVAFYDDELTASGILDIFNSAQPIDLSTIPSGLAADFSGGASEYATWGDIWNCFIFSNFSWSIWFKSTDTSSYIFSNRREAGSFPNYRGYALKLDSSGRLEFIISGTFGSDMRKRTNSSYNDGEWHHVVVTKTWVAVDQAPASSFTFYVDGAAVPTTVIANNCFSTLTHNTAVSLNVSGYEDGTGGLFTGSVDEFAIYRDGSGPGFVLDASEVLEIYNNGVPNDLTTLSTASELDGWWRMGDGDTFPTLTDYSVNGNDGTMAGGDIVFRFGTPLPVGWWRMGDSDTYPVIADQIDPNDGYMINMLPDDIVSNSPKEPGATGEQIYYFLMRGIDTACGTLTYHYWTVTEFPDFAGTEAGTLPCGGPLSDITVAASWSVIN